jgi:protein arginine N-methyltransferase 1
MTQPSEPKSHPASSTPEPDNWRARGHYVSLEHHRILLDDAHRMAAFDRAVRRLVSPGDVVLDLGAGTGILAMLAAKRGAARVHAVESAPIVQVAREIVEANGLSEQVIFYQQDAVEMDPVEPVDLVIGDWLGRFLVDDGMLQAVAAATRWLKPGGRFCPASVTLYLAPVGNFYFRAVSLWEERFFGLDLSPAVRYAINYCYKSALGPEAVLGEPQIYYQLDPRHPAHPFDAQLAFRIERDGVLRAIGGWFEAELAPEVTLSTEPGRETHWGQYLFPIPACEVKQGDEVEFHLWIEFQPDDIYWHWRGAVHRSGQRLSRFFELSSNQSIEAVAKSRGVGAGPAETRRGK